jgi:hypothetical protein
MSDAEKLVSIISGKHTPQIPDDHTALDGGAERAYWARAESLQNLAANFQFFEMLVTGKKKWQALQDVRRSADESEQSL